MNRTLLAALFFGLVGLTVGYLVFGRAGNSWVPIRALVMPGEGVLARFSETFRGIPEIRRNIALTGGAGAVVGALLNSVRR